MKFNKNKLFIGLTILFALGVAFWYGGNAPGLKGFSPTEDVENVEETEEAQEIEKDSKTKDKKEADEIEEKIAEANKEIEEKIAEAKESEANEETETDPEAEDEEENKSSTNQKADTNKQPNEESSPREEKKSAADAKERNLEEYSNKNGMEIDPETGKDQYETDPVPEGKPIPVEPENNPVTDEKKYATLSVSTKTLLGKLDWLPPNKVDLVPKDGLIYPAQKVEFFEGENVFDLLQREMKKSKIHMEFSKTPMYNSVYIEGINNLYEFDGGELSGWMYKVNNWFPNYGASRYSLKEGDRVDWVYTLDLGKDVGGGSSVGGN